MYNLNPNTLRTWERRYGIISPRRSEGGHRGFGAQDLTNIEMMLRLMAEGMSPSEAADVVRNATPRMENSSEATRVAELRHAFRSAVQQFDHAATLTAIQTTRRELGYTQCVEQVLFPELASLGTQWASRQSGVAMEHLATLAIQTMLLERQRELFPHSVGRTVILACAPGEQHVLPLLHVANLLADSCMYRPILMVGGLPITEIIEAGELTEAEAIVISATMTPRPDVIREWMSEIESAGWETRTVLAGGGFSRSRIFSEMRVNCATGSYDQVLKVLQRMSDGVSGLSRLLAST